MAKNPIEAVLGFSVLIFAGLFLFYAADHVNVGPVKGYVVNASFSKVGGLEMGADVRLNGIKIGSVTKIDLDQTNYQAIVELTIKDNIRLPKDSQAMVADAGIMGDKYIRLSVGRAKDYLKKGDSFAVTTPYKSLEDNVRELIFLSTKEDKKDD